MRWARLHWTQLYNLVFWFHKVRHPVGVVQLGVGQCNFHRVAHLAGGAGVTARRHDARVQGAQYAGDEEVVALLLVGCGWHIAKVVVVWDLVVPVSDVRAPRRHAC